MEKLKSYLKKTIVISAITFCLLVSMEGVCQRYVINPKSSIGFSLMSQICSNGYGTQYLPTLFYKSGRKSYSIAPTIQKRKMNLSGVQFNCEYALTGPEVKCDEDCPIELFVFLTLAYHQGAILGKSTEMAEKATNKAFSENNIANLRFSSTETYAGFGLKIPILKKFKWAGSIGFGYFQSINHPQNLYYRAHNVGLIINTEISMELKNCFAKRTKTP